MKWFKYILFFILGLGAGIAFSYIFLFYSAPSCKQSATCLSPYPEQALPTTNSEDSGIPILMYHHIRINPDPSNKTEASLDVTPSNFEDQMAYLYAKGYQAISLDELFSQSSSKKFIITFDDGYKDNIQNALPILKNLNYKATVFLIVEDIGKSGYLSWTDIKLLEKEGWSFGSHTLSHANLATSGEDKARKQIEESKTRLDRKLGKPVTFLAYPSGQFTQSAIDLIKEAGYTGAVTTLEGRDNKIEDIYQLKRIRVSGTDTLTKFIEKLNESSKKKETT